MNRIDRLTAILTHLQSKRIIRAVELAERFGVSLRTIYRDVRALEETGVPIIGEAGQGYSLVEGYRLSPVMFTKQEALAFVVAEKLLEKSMDEENSRFYKEALFKIKAILKTEEKDLVGRIDEQIKVVGSSPIPSQKQKSKNFQKVLEGISERKVLKGTYTTFVPQQSTERQIEPIGIYHHFSQWYLIAYCRLRKDYRTFRVDRFDQLQVLEEQFVLGKHPHIQKFLDQLSEEHQLHQIILLVRREGLKYLQTLKYNLGFVSERTVGDEIEMILMNSSLEYFLRCIVNMADMVRIVEPQALKDRLSQLLIEIDSRQKMD